MDKNAKMTRRVNAPSMCGQENFSVFSFLITVPKKKIANRVHIKHDIGVKAIGPADKANFLAAIFKNGINKIRIKVPKRIFCMASKIKKTGRAINTQYIAQKRREVPMNTGNSSKISEATAIVKKIYIFL